jgi:hypothetical protein
MNSTTSRYRRHAVLFAFLGAACVLFGAVTAPAATLTLVPPTGEFHCGNTWTIDVVLDGATTDLRGFSLVFEYDNSIITPHAVSVGGLVMGATCPNFLSWVGPPSADNLKVDVANLGCSVSGPGTILSIVFEGENAGTSSISVREGEMRDGTNTPIAFTSNVVSVHYDCAVPVDEASWGALKAIYR